MLKRCPRCKKIKSEDGVWQVRSDLSLPGIETQHEFCSSCNAIHTEELKVDEEKHRPVQVL